MWRRNHDPLIKLKWCKYKVLTWRLFWVAFVRPSRSWPSFLMWRTEGEAGRIISPSVDFSLPAKDQLADGEGRVHTSLYHGRLPAVPAANEAIYVQKNLEVPWCYQGCVEEQRQVEDLYIYLHIAILHTTVSSVQTVSMILIYFNATCRP